MLINRFYFFGLYLFLISCNGSETNVVLDQKTRFHIPDNYRIVRLTENDVETYNAIIKNIENKIVLYKVLTGLNTRVYIGICYNSSREEVQQILQNNSGNNALKFIKYDDFSFSNSQIFSGSCYVMHYYREFKPSGNKYLFSITGNSEIQLTEKFLEEKVIDQIY